MKKAAVIEAIRLVNLIIVMFGAPDEVRPDPPKRPKKKDFFLLR